MAERRPFRVPYSVEGFVTYYNLICAERGFSMPPHMIPAARMLVDRRISKGMIIIGPGCLIGDTIVGVERLAGAGLKKLTLEELYHKFNGLPWYVPTSKSCGKMLSREWNLEIPTRTLSWCDDRLAMNLIKRVIKSGVKEIYELVTEGGNRIRASYDHPIKAPDSCKGVDPDGFKALGKFCLGDTICIRNNDPYKGGRIKKKKSDRRRYVYSIQYHPYAHRNFVYKKDYKRLPLARIVIEADMNKITVSKFINILRNEPEVAAKLKYIPLGYDVHHKNEDETDDRLDNLEILTPKEHLAEHAKEKQKNFGNVLLKEDIVKSVKYVGKKMTYDIVMADPYRNFLADDFVVHNSGKSVAMSEVYPSFEIGHDPTMTLLGISAGEALMQGFLRSVMETIKFSPVFKGLFPRVKPDEAAGWSADRGMFVTGREMGNPDANFAATGLDSKRLTGLHARLLLCDDLHDDQNAGNIEQCDKVWTRWNNTVLGRGDPRGARYIVAGRRWNQHDIYSRLMESGEWVVLELPAEREGTTALWVDVTVPDEFQCCFTDHLFTEGAPPPKRRVRLNEKRKRVRL